MSRIPPKFFRFLMITVTVFLLAALVSLGVNFWVFKEIQKRLKVHLEGQYVPTVFVPSFRLEKGSFNWEDRVRLVEGSIKVGFDPLTLFSGRGMRIVVKSSGAKIKFLGNWAVQEGIEDATVDTLYADVILGRRGISGINEIEARSPKFQFSLKNVDKK